MTGFGLGILQFFGHALYLGHVLHAEALAAEHGVIVKKGQGSQDNYREQMPFPRGRTWRSRLFHNTIQ